MRFLSLISMPRVLKIPSDSANAIDAASRHENSNRIALRIRAALAGQANANKDTKNKFTILISQTYKNVESGEKEGRRGGRGGGGNVASRTRHFRSDDLRDYHIPFIRCRDCVLM